MATNKYSIVHETKEYRKVHEQTKKVLAQYCLLKMNVFFSRKGIEPKLGKINTMAETLGLAKYNNSAHS